MYARRLKYTKDKSFFLFGPRGVGKTRWVRQTFPQAHYFDLLDSAVYSELLASPRRLGELIPAGFAERIIIDEVQRVPELLNEVHRLIESRGLQFVLTGSSARKLRRAGVNLLAGRALTLHMHALTAGEAGNDFKLDRALRMGMLPAVFSEPDPSAYLKSYVGTYLREEVLQEGLTRKISAFARFLEAASFSQASTLNMAAAARDSEISVKVAEDYFTILEDLLIAVRVPVFARRAKRRLSAHPKFFFFDAGVFRAVRPRGPLDTDAEIGGAALETLLLQQLRAVNDYGGCDYQIYFWRTAAHAEVDFVLYGPQGLIAIEVKRSDRVRGEDLAALKLFREDYPEARAYLLYLGAREWHDSGVEVRNFENMIRGLDACLAEGQAV